MNWNPDTILKDRYKIIKLLETTERCEVYAAKEIKPPYRPVAIKRLRPGKEDEEDVVKRFEREIAALSLLILEPYVLRILDIEKHSFVTEYAKLGSLKDYLKSKSERRLNASEALDIAISVVKGLEAAHSHNMVHRDIKPGNILLFVEPDKSVTAKLGDFSISAFPYKLEDKKLTRTGQLLGTLEYTAPEQLAGKPADKRSDLYSWAIVVFEMLTGELPTESLKDPFTYEPVEELYSIDFFVNKDIPQQLARVLQKALCSDRSQRYQSASELLQDLKDIGVQIAKDAIAAKLDLGEKHLRQGRWQQALTDIQQGLDLCEWYGSSINLKQDLLELSRRLMIALECAQGMIHFDHREWKQVSETLQKVVDYDPHYLDLDVEGRLKRAKREFDWEQKYQAILEYRRQEEWTKVLRLSQEFTSEYRGTPDGETITEIRKLALYARGNDYRLEGNLSKAYRSFYRLYEKDPDYQDVASLCATMAYRLATRDDELVPLEDKIHWLAKAVGIVPDFRDGRTQAELYRMRYRRATELSKQGHLEEAVQHLRQIGLDSEVYSKARKSLAEGCVELGYQARKNKEWEEASQWWQAAISVDQTQEGKLGGLVREVRIRAWIGHHEQDLMIVSVIFAILAVAVAVWQPWQDLSEIVKPSPSPSASLTLPIVVTPSPVFDLTSLCNGSFDYGWSCWDHGGELTQTVVLSGSNHLVILGSPDYPCLGGIPVGEAWIGQPIQVPDAGEPSLSFSYELYSYDIDTSDTFEAYVNKGLPDEKLVVKVGNTDWAQSDCGRSVWRSGWRSERISLKEFKGKSITLSFHNVNRKDQSWNTWTLLDDVLLLP